MVRGTDSDYTGHALVIGGTGMLRGTSLELAARGYIVSVVARSQDRLARLQQETAKSPGDIHPIALDYRDSDALRAALQAASKQHGAISVAVVWAHSIAPEAPYIAAETVRGHYVHVLGSAGADPSRPDTGRRERFAAFQHLRYTEAILGFVRQGGRSRWLTNAEISAGVLQALDGQDERFIVGTVEPWSARP